MPSIVVNGVRWWSNNCSPESYWSGKNGTGNAAPPEVYEAVYRKWERRLGRKASGAPKKTETADERRLVMYESGMSLEEIGNHDGVYDLENVRRSINRGRKRRAARAVNP